MQFLDIQGTQVSYTMAGDGFPLVLTPGVPGGWAPLLPLLGELCRAMAYEPVTPSAPDADAAWLAAVVQALGLERTYMASPASGWHATLTLARQHPRYLEGVILLATAPVPTDIAAGLMADAAVWPTLTVPTLLLTTEAIHAASPVIAWLQARLRRGTTQQLAAPDGLSLPLGHAMLRFLLDCERQRNLVRGASFLL